MPPSPEGRRRSTSAAQKGVRNDTLKAIRPVGVVATAVPHRSETILVVEDDPALLAFYKSALMIAGFAVVTASDGLEALHRIEGRLPDLPALLVLDLGLPRLSGRDVRHEIAAHAHTRHIPVVVVTGDASADGADVDCVLLKPVDAESLVTAVEDCLRQARRR